MNTEQLLQLFGMDVDFYTEILQEGGGFKLSWEELNTKEDREDSLYLQDDVSNILYGLSTSISPYLLVEGTENLVAVSLEECGLSIGIPAVNTEGWIKINTFLKTVLTEDDFQSLDWEVCYSDGYSACYWD